MSAWHGIGLVVTASLAAASSARATSVYSGPYPVTGFTVTEGKVAFCQADGSFTALLLTTGVSLVSDAQANCYAASVLTTPHGLLMMGGLNSHSIRMVDLTATIARQELQVRWTYDDEKQTRLCRSLQIAGDSFLCAVSDQRPSARPFAVEKRGLADGRLIWSYAAPESVADIIVSDGLVMAQSGVYRLARQVSIIDLGTGALRARADVVQDASFSVASFDGRRVELITEVPATGSCTGWIVRTLTLDATATALTAADGCRPDDPRRRSARAAMDPWQTRDGRPWQNRPDGGSWKGREVGLSFDMTSRGFWIDAVGDGIGWSAFHRHPGQMPPWIEVHEGKGVIFLETARRKGGGAIECLDAATGQPRWLYWYGFSPPEDGPPTASTTVRLPQRRGTPSSEPPEAALLDQAYPGRIVIGPPRRP